MNKKLLLYGALAIILALIYRFLPNYFYVQGKYNFEQKKYDKAYEYLDFAYNSDRKNQTYRYYLVKTMVNLKPSKDIQQKIFEISTDKINDGAHSLAESQIKKWRHNVLRNIGDNYIEQVPTDKKIMRWSKFPIKYTIVNNSGTDVPNYYNAEIKKAIYQWQASTGFLKFAETSDLASADIVIEIKKIPDNVCNGDVCQFVLGFTTPDYTGQLLKKMDIVLYDKNPLGNFFSEKDLFNTVLHEMGHALGIMGHSYGEDDIMYMSANQEDMYTQDRSYFQYLSTQDINTITLLYKLIPDITNSKDINTENLVYAPIVLGTGEDISNRKIKEAKNYIKNAPNMAGGYIDLGIAYSELNRTDEAIEAMQKAYLLAKTNNEEYMALYNLAVIYFNSGNGEKAKEYARKAQQISDSEEIRTLIDNIQ